MPMVSSRQDSPSPRGSHRVLSAIAVCCRPGDGSTSGRRVDRHPGCAMAVGQSSLTTLHTTLSGVGAVPRFVGARLGPNHRLSTAAWIRWSRRQWKLRPPVLFDALVLPDGEATVATLDQDGHTLGISQDSLPPLPAGTGAGSARICSPRRASPPPLPSGRPRHGRTV